MQAIFSQQIGALLLTRPNTEVKDMKQESFSQQQIEDIKQPAVPNDIHLRYTVRPLVLLVGKNS